MPEPKELIDTLKGRARMLWVKACHFDGIAPQSSFVVFSKDNPHQAEYFEAVTALQDSLKPKKKPKKEKWPCPETT